MTRENPIKLWFFFSFLRVCQYQYLGDTSDITCQKCRSNSFGVIVRSRLMSISANQSGMNDARFSGSTPKWAAASCSDKKPSRFVSSITIMPTLGSNQTFSNQTITMLTNLSEPPRNKSLILGRVNIHAG